MYKILVIDDKQENLYVIEEIINERLDNAQVFSKLSGSEGIKCAITELPDVILLDLMMPVMDGFEVCSKLKSNNKTKHIPVVIISGIMTDAESKIKALELGADSFLSKPIGPTELVAQIKAMIRIKKAEDKLREENLILGSIVNKASKKIDFTLKRYQNIFDKNIAGVVETTFDGRIISCNSAFAKMLGLKSVEEVLENKITSFYSNKNEREKIISLLKEKKEVLNYEVEAITKNGKPSTALFRSFNIEDEYILSFIIDITNIKESEKELRKSQQRLRNHLDNNPLGSIFWDKNFKVTDWNRSAERIFGYTKDEALGKHIKELIIIEEYQTKTDKILKQILTKKEGEQSTYENITKTGKRILCKWNNVAITDTNGKVTGVASLVEDITERKLLEKQILGLANILESSLNEIYIFDAATLLFINVNKGARKNLGYSYDEIKKLTPLDIKPEFTKECFEELVKPLRNREQDIMIFNAVHQRKDGSRYPVEVHLQYAALEEKDVFVAFIIDITEHKKAENALRESETSLKEAQKIANIGNWTRELTGELHWSEQQYRIYGYEPGEIKPNFEIVKSHVHPDDLDTFMKSIDNTVKIRKPFALEYRLITKDGTQKFVSAHANVELDKSGNPIRLRGTLQDITERKKAEDEIKRNEKRYRELFEDNITGVYVTTLDGKILDCNNAFYKMLGYSNKDEILKINIENFYKVKQNREYFLKKLKEKGCLINNEVQLKKKDGSIIWVLKNVNLVDGSTIQGTIIDITEKKEAEKKIMQLSRGLEQSPALVIITDVEGNIEYVNPKTTEVTGYTQEELIGKNSRIFQSEQTPKETYKELWETILQGKVWKGELLNKRKNGELYWDSVTIAPIIDNEGDIINYIAIREDITEKKKMTEELIKAKEKAEELYRLKSNLLANMSHELRTPLVGILGFTEILEESIKDEELKGYAALINENGSRLLETLTLILNLSKIESEQTEIIFTEIDVIEEVENCVKLFEKVALNKGLFIKVKYGDERIILNSDIRMFNEIINNLINNALKYTNDGGVTVYVRKTKDNKSAEIKVQDTGIGIPQEKQNLIWDEFRQVSEGDSRMFEGTGLGLTITNKFVKLLGGKISLESETGIGSTFTVIFPLDKQKQNDVLPEKISDNRSSKTKGIKKQKHMHTILYIEDDEIARSLVSLFLKDLYKIELAKNGLEGLEKAKHEKYDIILMDINLKLKPDGIETFRKIKELKNYKTTPVIAITAYAMAEDRAKYLNIGFSNYISKPFTKKDLVALLEKYTPKN